MADGVIFGVPGEPAINRNGQTAFLAKMQGPGITSITWTPSGSSSIRSCCEKAASGNLLAG